MFIHNNNIKNLNNNFTPHLTSNIKKKNKKKFCRIILSINETPSLHDDCGLSLSKSLRFHTNRRVEFLYLNFLLRYLGALRSDGSIVDVKTWIGPTTMQGHTSRKEKHHASHCNTGTIHDNLLVEHVKIAQREEKITPHKKRHLMEIAGLSNEEVLKLIDPYADVKEVKKIVDKVKRCRSMIFDSQFENNLNMTVSLPRDSNLMIDKFIENDVRKNFLPQKMKEVMQGLSTPVKATQEYIQVMKQRLDILLENLNQFDEVFREVHQSIKICIHIESKGYLDNVDGDLYYNEVLKIKPLLINLKKHSDEVVKFGIKDLKMTVRSLLPRARKKIATVKYVDRTKTLWRHKVGFSLNKDSYDQLISVESRIVQLRMMIAKQKKGTVEPNYQDLLNIEGGGKNKTENDVKEGFYKRQARKRLNYN